jgi:hypothetical protein
MVDINKLRELNAALQEGLISQEEYDKIKTNLIDDSNSTKVNSSNLLTDKLNNNRSNSNSSVQTIPADGLQHIIINNNNNNNNNNLNNNDDGQGQGCYQNTAAHLVLTLLTGFMWLPIWLILAIFKI